MLKCLVVILFVGGLVLAAGQVMADDQQKALEWYQKGNATLSLTKQVEYYTKAIELAPNWAYPYNNRGVAYYHLGEFEKSKADFDKALGLKPDYNLALANRAGANFNKKEAAMEVWESSYLDRLAAGF